MGVKKSELSSKKGAAVAAPSKPVPAKQKPKPAAAKAAKNGSAPAQAKGSDDDEDDDDDDEEISSSFPPPAKANGKALGAMNPNSRNLTPEAMAKGRQRGALAAARGAGL